MTASTTGCSESPAVSPKHLPEARQTSPAVVLPRVHFRRDKERSSGTAAAKPPNPAASTAGMGTSVCGPGALEERRCAAFESSGTARRGSSLQEIVAPALCFEVLDLQTGQIHHPAACKPGAKGTQLAHVRSGSGSRQTQHGGERRLVDMVPVARRRRLEHTGEPLAIGMVLQLVTATSKADPPAQGPPPGAIPT